MTCEEALEILEHKCKSGFCSGDCDNEELAKLIDEAIKKQIPKKPHKNYDKLSARWCDCGWYVRSKNDGFKYCPNCGQAIDWSDFE